MPHFPGVRQECAGPKGRRIWFSAAVLYFSRDLRGIVPFYMKLRREQRKQVCVCTCVASAGPRLPLLEANWRQPILSWTTLVVDPQWLIDRQWNIRPWRIRDLNKCRKVSAKRDQIQSFDSRSRVRRDTFERALIYIDVKILRAPHLGPIFPVVSSRVEQARRQ